MRIRTVLTCGIVAVLLAACDHSIGTPTSPAAVIGPTTAPVAPAVTRGVLGVQSVALIEFQYSGQPTRWLYAPRVRVTETSGNAPVWITGAEISIPGQGTWVCVTEQTVGAGQTLELFPEFYDDYGLSFEKPGHRSSGNAVIVVLGSHGSLIAPTRVTPGELPPSYSGGRGTWSSCRLSEIPTA